MQKFINNKYKEKQIIPYTVKRIFKNLSINVELIIRFSSVVMQGKRKSRECHTRFFR